VGDWYRGRYIRRENDPSSSVVFFGHHQQPRFAKTLGAVGQFWLDHWKWIVTTGLAAWYGIHKLVK